MSIKKRQLIKTLSHCVRFGDPHEYYTQLLQLGKEAKKNQDYKFLQKIMNALGSQDRLFIIDSLRQKDRCVCELVIMLNKSQGAVSRDLKILEESQLIRGWKKGKFTHYSLVKSVFEKFTNLMNNWLATTKNWFGNLSDHLNETF
ncbi:MAG: ArsR/SmtB family transcription factor [Candidatus Helarchaeota archaeon]